MSIPASELDRARAIAESIHLHIDWAMIAAGARALGDARGDDPKRPRANVETSGYWTRKIIEGLIDSGVLPRSFLFAAPRDVNYGGEPR